MNAFHRARPIVRGSRAVLLSLFVVAAAACGGSDDDGGSGGSGGIAAGPTVPASAGESSAGFLDYLRALIALGGDETSEPKDLGNLASPPADETSEPSPIS